MWVLLEKKSNLCPWSSDFCRNKLGFGRERGMWACVFVSIIYTFSFTTLLLGNFVSTENASAECRGMR